MRLATKKAIEEAFGNIKTISELSQPLEWAQCPHTDPPEGTIKIQEVQMSHWSDGVNTVLLGYCYKCEKVYYHEL